MSDYSAKPSGSLALDYDMSSDESDQEESITISSKLAENSSVEVNDCAVAEASPAESGVESGSEPATSSESKEPVPEDEPMEEEEEEDAGLAGDVGEEPEHEKRSEPQAEQQDEDPDDTPEPSREESMEMTGNEQEQNQDESPSSADENSDDEEDENDDEEEKSREPVSPKKEEEVKEVEQIDQSEVKQEEEAGPEKEEQADSDDNVGSDESKAETVDDIPPGTSNRKDDTSDDDSNGSDSNDEDDEEDREMDGEDDRDEKQAAEQIDEKPDELPDELPEDKLEEKPEAELDEKPEEEPMDVSMASEASPETETNGVVAADDNSGTENPWESPKQNPVNGIVQPRVIPPAGKPTRHTNCLDFVLFTVVKDALKHKHSWPFQTPVDTNKLEIPEYHNIVSKPMDLRTIERRLRNLYYWCAEEAIKDINQLFTNCYTFNPPEYDVFKMAKTLEKQVLSQLTEIPSSDLNVLFDNCKKFNDRNDDIYIMCENIEGVVQRGLEWMPTQEQPAELAEHHRRGMFPASTPSGKTKGPKPRGRKSTRGRKKSSLSRSAAPAKEDIADDLGDDESSKVESVLNFDDDDNDTEKDVDSRAMSVQDDIEEIKPSTSQTPAKGTKRKAENGDNGITAKVVVAEPPAPPPAPVVAPTPTLPPRKNPNSMIDWKSLVPRWHGKQAEWQKFGAKILSEFHSVRNKSFAQIFYLPVDPIKLKIFDYLDIIKNPMDIQTMKKKFEYKQYAEPDEFVQDLYLMVNNCCTYNPKGSSVYQNALDVKSYFESRWAQCPLPGTPIEPPQALVVNVDLMEDERINSYLTAVKAEEKKCAEKLDMLRNVTEGLYGIAMQRREAKLVGHSAPVLPDSQINQLDRLGITIKPIAPVMMVPELISPAISVRSSGRAPVPKIIDDIGPSPIKSRKISKPRQSTASSISVVVPTPSTRGRKKKSGRPRKTGYSPAVTPPPVVAPQPPVLPVVQPYVSMYGRKSVSNKEKLELSEKMGNIPVDFIAAVLRIMQIGQHNAGKVTRSLRSICDEEIDFNDVPDDIVIELLDYMHMINVDRPRALKVKTELEEKAKLYGFDDTDMKGPIVKRRKLEQAPQSAQRSESPSPSASRSGNRSSESESDSSDSEPSRENSPVRVVKRPSLSGSSSRASTPAGPSRAPVSVAQPARPTKDSFVAHKPVYPKRTLSESSSSSESNSSDSSDSDSEPKHQVHKQPTPQKKKVLKKTAPPPKQKKQAPLSILDELLPDTPGLKPKMASIPAPTPYTRNMPPESISLQKAYSPPRVSEDQQRAQREIEHNEALQRQAEARRRRALLEDQPVVHQQEVMQAFESQYGDFNY